MIPIKDGNLDLKVIDLHLMLFCDVFLQENILWILINVFLLGNSFGSSLKCFTRKYVVGAH